MIRGRRKECEAVDGLLAHARTRRSGVLVVRGEAGIGKTELLKYARDNAAGFRTVHTVGVESEIGFAFAGLHQLCAPLLDRIDALAEPQQDALGVAFGLRAGRPPDPFLVGLATLSLLAEASEEQPLLCLVDDAQWLDHVSAQVLMFVARRLHAERVALIFGLRDPVPDLSVARAAVGLPELRLNGLSDADARALLATAVLAPLDKGVHDQVIAESRGNPLALLELSRHAEPAGLAGGFGLPDAMSVPERIEERFQHRSAVLPAQTRLLLLVAAAEQSGDPALLWRAAGHLGIRPEAAAPAEEAELVEIGTRVRFSHPLVRSAVYRAAKPAERRRAHGALAAATDPGADPDRRAWHRAQAVLGPNETAAAELERSADRARERGGLAASAAFLERATALTPQPADRSRRALAAAQAKLRSGAPKEASGLLAVAVAGQLDVRDRARAELLRAEIAFQVSRGGVAPRMLLDVAKTFTPLDPLFAREVYLQAMEAAVHAGALDPGRVVVEAAEAARGAPPPPSPPRPADLLLDGLVTRFSEGSVASVPALRRAVQAYRDHRTGAEDDDQRGLWLACRAALGMYDNESARELLDRKIRAARRSGALDALAMALNFQATVLISFGDLTRAAELVVEADAIVEAIGSVPRPHGGLLLAAWRGRQTEARELAAGMIKEATERGEGAVVTFARYTLAVLHNGHGDYKAALDAATLPAEYDELSHTGIALPELVEAAVRTGETSRAAHALELLGEYARTDGMPWARGFAARSRAITSTGPAAEELYREAIEQFAAGRMMTDLGRAHLVYGEWLRREGRRQDAREQLRTAHEKLSAMGAEAFVVRAARELRATGEQPRKRTTAQAADSLTAHELQIARLVAAGATSKEVGAQLYLSPRTIDAHLRNIFRKLGITSRRQLRTVLLS
ncbi:ATP-binding protein [Streptomyces sp. NRRL S-813]|uniref:ATP-binding protein n=1 Tax=Streptomyces sp. NRRL S-813 TaxID=1463919 RepID=UPI0004C03255|nr:helix-turn-helix transcriptional regulator [Streptomyces sp. NRRL S-813]